MKIRYLQLMLSMLLLVAMLPPLAFAEEKPAFALSASNQPANVGDVLAVTVEGRNIKDVYGYELRLTYDPAVLKLKEAKAAWEGFSVPPIDESGSLTFAHTKIGKTKGESGSLRFATIQFEAIAQKDTEVRLTRVKLVDSDSGSITAEPSFSLPISMAKQPPKSYYEDTIGHWAEEEITRATEMGWVTGYPDGRFAPQEEVTRAQFATMLSRALAPTPPSEAALPFADEAQIPAYAKPHVSLWAAAGIIKGYEDGTFRPARSITRSEITTLLMRVLGHEDQSDQVPALAYADTDAIPSWARSAVAAATDIGLVKGRDNNQFVPGGYTTRAEAVTLILRLLDYQSEASTMGEASQDTP